MRGRKAELVTVGCIDEPVWNLIATTISTPAAEATPSRCRQSSRLVVLHHHGVELRIVSLHIVEIRQIRVIPLHTVEIRQICTIPLVVSTLYADELVGASATGGGAPAVEGGEGSWGRRLIAMSEGG